MTITEVAENRQEELHTKDHPREPGRPGIGAHCAGKYLFISFDGSPIAPGGRAEFPFKGRVRRRSFHFQSLRIIPACSILFMEKSCFTRWGSASERPCFPF